MKKLLSLLIFILFLLLVERVNAELFDNCDKIDNWNVLSDKLGQLQGNNTLKLDYTDKVEGNASLKMTWAADGPNWGGLFYKRPSGAVWDFSSTPILRMRFKTNNTLPPNFKFSIVTGTEENLYAWNIYTYNISNKINTTGEWFLIDIDLRFPDTYEEWPDLRFVQQIEFQSWGTVIENPSTFKIDFLEKVEGPPIPLEGYIKPKIISAIPNESVNFIVKVRGGVEPYSYEWYVNDTKQSETSRNFTFVPTRIGKYIIKVKVTDANKTSITLTANLTVLSVAPFPESNDLFKSEVRAMFVQPGWYLTHNWTLIAETCKKYGINTIILEISLCYLWENSTCWPGGTGEEKPRYFPELGKAIDAFHKYGFNVHLLSGTGREVLEPEMVAIKSDGTQADQASFTKNVSREIFLKLFTFLAENYNFEGFGFDDDLGYYDNTDYSEEARQEFIRETGLTNVNWPTDVVEGGKYFSEFIEWRMDEITEFVELIRNAMLAKKPNLLFHAAVYAPLRGGDYWAYAYAQHVADWIDKGLIDFVAPMIGTRTLYGFDSVDERCNLTYEYFLGEKEGKIPFIPYTGYWSSGNERPIDNFIEAIKIMKNYSLDGWILWRYGGPGWARGDPDVRPYLSALIEAGLMEPVWAIQNLSLIINQKINQTQISWMTTVPTKSKIEYSSSKLFNGTVRYSERQFHYKDIDYLGGTIQEDSSFKTIHSFTLPMTNIKEFRVQSVDGNNTKITSSPFSFSDLLNLSVNGKIGPRINLTFQTFYKGINVSYVTSTDSEGNYRLYLMPSLYDILYHTNNFWLKQVSTSIYSNAYNKLSSLKFYPEKTSLSFDITKNQTVQVYSEKKPLSVLKNSFYLEERSSLEDLLNSYGWFYNESEKILYAKFNETIV